MKIRKCFVSNSSSSSFVCDVCGEETSGMDLSRREAGYEECELGHLYCEDHSLPSKELSKEEKLKALIDDINNKSYLTPEQKATYIKDYLEYDEEEIDEKYNDYVYDKGVSCSQCPICSFVKIHDYQALTYLLKSRNISKEQLLEEMKNKFDGDYKKLIEFITIKK